MKIFFDFRKSIFFNFKAIPDTLEGALNNGKERYNPPVSDVSDCEVVALTDSMKKASKPGNENTFGIFMVIMTRKAAHDKIRQNRPGITALNPPRTENKMLDLEKKRWVCVSSIIMKLYNGCVKSKNFGTKGRYGKMMTMNW